MSEYFVEGWTVPIDYQLKKDGQPFDATGQSVSLELRGKDGAVITETGTTGWLDAAQSKVRYTPAAADLAFAQSPIRVRFKVTAGGQVGFFPRSEPEEWIIGRP